MQQKFFDLVENARTDNNPVEVIVVGGGAILVDAPGLAKALNCPVKVPEHGAVANACGSAQAQAFGERVDAEDDGMLGVQILDAAPSTQAEQPRQEPATSADKNASSTATTAGTTTIHG